MDEELTGSTQVNRCKELNDVPERCREEYGSPPAQVEAHRQRSLWKLTRAHEAALAANLEKKQKTSNGAQERGKAEQAEAKIHEYVVTPKSGLNTRSCYHQNNKAGYTRRRGTEGCVEVEDRRR